MTDDAPRPIPYTLEPFVGVGAARFGMTQAQVAQALGAPDSEKMKNARRVIEEARAGVSFEYWLEDDRTLGAVCIPKQGSITYDGVDLMNGKDGVARLKAADATWKDHGQYMQFPELGVLLGGFGKRRIPEGKLIIVYARARARVYTLFVTA